MAPILNNYGPAEAAWRGLDAGLDVVLMPKDAQAALSGIVTAVGDGSLDPARLAEAATRVYALRLALARSATCSSTAARCPTRSAPRAPFPGTWPGTPACSSR